MIKLRVTRHGQTDYNLQNRYAGSSDVPLNAVGFEQARALCGHPLIAGIDRIVSSPLLRAVQTAEILRETTGRPLSIAEAFAERCVGVYEGHTREEVQRLYPALWAEGAARRPDWAPPGGDTLLAFTERIGRGLDGLRAEYDGQTVLLVCHAFAAREIRRAILGLPYEAMNDFTLHNGEIAAFQLR